MPQAETKRDTPVAEACAKRARTVRALADRGRGGAIRLARSEPLSRLAAQVDPAELSSTGRFALRAEHDDERGLIRSADFSDYILS